VRQSAEIVTKNLRLIVPTVAEVLESIDAMSESDRAQVSPDWLARAKAATDSDPWIHGFAMVHRESGELIGKCGFAAPPAGGVVEIAYGVDPSWQGRGFATEAARGLADFAFRSGAVSLVYAHTLPHENASTRVLTKCGFERIGEVMHPEDGLVWRWELPRDER
jgi:RimJ/RimL family protein N-acetyltransferase